MIFIDIEGSPMQELAAISSDKTGKILDVFHAFVYYPYEVDLWSRRHLHGIDPNYIEEIAYKDPDSLKRDFYKWFDGFENVIVYANNSSRETAELPRITFLDLPIKPWAERQHEESYKMALEYKRNKREVLGKSCGLAHGAYVGWVSRRKFWTAGDFARHCHSFHCALYDCLHIYLAKIHSM